MKRARIGSATVPHPFRNHCREPEPKGGLGLPVVVSVLFFLVYHIISTVGEKSVKEGNLSPVMGMWMAIFILTPLGLFLTYKATIDSALFDVDIYKNLFKKAFKNLKLK